MNTFGEDIILLGAGAHARMLQVFLSREGHVILGCVSPALPLSQENAVELAWLGNDDWLADQNDVTAKIVNAIGSVGETDRRRRAYCAAIVSGKIFLNYCHPSATIDPTVSTGIGLQILAGAIVQPGCRIGDNVLINTAAVLEHEVVIADHVHVAPRACVCGGARIDEAAHIGAGAVVMQGCMVGQGAVIGAGAVVTSDVAPGMTVVGVPARPTGTKADD